MRKRTLFFGALPPLLFCILGLGCLSFPGYRFSAIICFGIACLILYYYGLLFLRRSHRKTANVLLTILSSLLCIGILLACVTGGIIANAATEPDTSCQYMIVLGAGVNGTRPSLILSERINRAYDYLTEHPEVVCVLSGGQGSGEDISEAQCMYEQLTAKGIDPTRLLLEDQSTDTRENIRFSLDVLEQVTGQRPKEAAIVSNEFHLYRAGLFAKEQDLQMVGVPAKTTWISLRINYFLREIVAVWYYTLLGG